MYQEKLGCNLGCNIKSVVSKNDTCHNGKSSFSKVLKYLGIKYKVFDNRKILYEQSHICSSKLYDALICEDLF